jgi:hypothetical protein
MNDLIRDLYKSCKSKEALASQNEYNSADVLLGLEVEKFAELIVRDVCQKLENDGMVEVAMEMKQHFGVK